jgi:hypothetical protein
MTLLATLVDTKALLETVVASAIAGLGVTLAFSLSLLGVARFADMRAGDRPLAASVFAAVAVLAFVAVVAAIVFGIVVMTSK